MHDIDPTETREWLEALDAVLAYDGGERARFLLQSLHEHASLGAAGSSVFACNTPYINSIGVDRQAAFPGDLAIEERLRKILRWNAMAMVARANKNLDGIGGHIATYQSVSTLFETGFNHFWRVPGANHGGDLVYFQGHASPGIYARAFLEGRLDAEDLDRFRQEVGGGLPSYPHPWLMSDFWQFATVSMGLGPLSAIYQARYMRYLHHRKLADTDDRYVWAFLGDGEMDEPESLGALGIAAREHLDNLIFVVNCNLQRLDGPVRGNGKIVDELEGTFRGAGWNVIKLLWASEWDDLFARDTEGRLRKRMGEILDGELQVYPARDGAYAREHLFGTDPKLAALVEHLSDAQLGGLRRGGHDTEKVHAAYAAAIAHEGQPTVILAQTVKGFGLGTAGEGLNIAHNVKNMGTDAVRAFRDRLDLPIPDEGLEKIPYFRPAEDSDELRYLRERRDALGGPMPVRNTGRTPALPAPDLEIFKPLLDGSGERQISTTMAFVRILTLLLRDKALSRYLVPIIADEARTFGMEGLFRQLGIYAPQGQLYEPVDAGQLMFYKEAQDGQVLQEGINEAGSLASWTAAATAYVNHGVPTIPFFIFYSMFGFQRVADSIWAAADQQARGFLLGATSGRTTLNGEGLQHEDGHSHLVAATVPNCVAYDPTYGYELAVIIQDGLRRMVGEQENVFYYLTTLNENYPQPALPEGAEDGIRRGLYRLRTAPSQARKKRVQLLGSGAILLEALAAAELLEENHGVTADVWSVTSFTELRRDGLACDRWNTLHPEAEAKVSFVATNLAGTDGPVIAATDYMHAFADQIRTWVDGRYVTLGTDGFGRSDSRAQLRHFFEVDRTFIAITALKALADEGALPAEEVARAIAGYGIDPEKADPTTV